MNNKKSRLPIRHAYGFNDKMTLSEKIFFGFACTLSAFFIAIIQTCFFFNFRPFGFAPDLCLALAVATGLKFGAKCGGIVGLLSGFFLDCISSNGLSLAIPFYLALGIAVGLLFNDDSELNLPHFVIFLIGIFGGGAVSGLFTTVRILLTYSSFNTVDVIFKTVFPELLCTAAFSLTVYPLAALVSRIIKKNQGFYQNSQKK